MTPPRFWNNPPDHPGWQAWALAPASFVAALLAARRARKTGGNIIGIPVICVGNINIGGTGKTPTVIALVDHLVATGRSPHVVSRGYGGNITGPVRVDEKIHDASDVGDEPLLLSAFASTWVSDNRIAGIEAADAAGADVIVLDDGFQDPSITKDLSIVVVDAATGFGNGWVFPSGPLREPVARGLDRADLVISIGTAKSQATFDTRWGAKVLVPQCRAELMPLATGMDWRGLDVMAFAGIGQPDKFFATLRALGANVIHAEALDDHQPLTDTLLTRLEQEATRRNAQLVTTEKDAVRLPVSFRPKVLTLPVRLSLTDWEAINEKLAMLGLMTKD